MCGFCHAAKRLLKDKGVNFSEINVWSNPSRKPEMIQRANGGRTVPQIFVGDVHVGGCDDLYALDQRCLHARHAASKASSLPARSSA